MDYLLSVPLTVIGGLGCAEWRKERQSVNNVKYFGKALYFTLGRSSRRVVMKEAGLDQTRTLSWRVCPRPTGAPSSLPGCKVDVYSAHHVEFHGVRCASAGVTRKKRNARDLDRTKAPSA